MTNSTSNTYTMKRYILTFSNKISSSLNKSDSKFTADMTYGILTSNSCLLTDIVDQLHETTKKVNSVERLSRHLVKGVPDNAINPYHETISKWVPSDPVIHIDDSDVIKPEGYKFESLGRVRDGSKSTKSKTFYEKGYLVTQACVLSNNHHPISIYSRIHSSLEKNYKSANTITFKAIDQGVELRIGT